MQRVPRRVLYENMSREFLLAAPRVHNINTVVTFWLDIAKINLIELSQRLPGIAVELRKFAAGTIRLEEAVSLIFSSGSVVCAGSTSVAEARGAASKIVTMLLGAGYLVRFTNFVVTNIVCHANTGFYVDLAAAAAEHNIDMQHDPSRFPGAIFRFRQPAVVITVFVAGPVIITGSRDRRDTEACWAWFYLNVLVPHRLVGERPATSAHYRHSTLLSEDDARADLAAIYREYRDYTLAADTSRALADGAFVDALFDEMAAETAADAARNELPRTAADAARAADARISAAEAALFETVMLRDAERRLALERDPYDADVAAALEDAIRAFDALNAPVRASDERA